MTDDTTTKETPPQRSRVIDGSPFYYGWVVLAAATFGMMMTTPGQTVGVSVFLDRMIADLGMSRPTVSLLYSIGTLCGSLALPFVGRFIDRRGPRLSVILISLGFGLACLYMGVIQGPLMLAVGFLLIRGLGQGALGLVSIHVINVWFVRRRGLAVGLSGIGFALATAFFPLLIETLIRSFDWRVAYMILGGLILLLMLPLGALLYRGHPERFGLQPDGATTVAVATPLQETNYTLAQARRTATFWLFAGGNMCAGMLGTGLVFHHYSVLAEAGIDRVAAASVFIPFGFITAGVNLLTGFLMDRSRPTWLLALMLLFQVVGLVLASFIGAGIWLVVYGLVLGTTQGMNGAISSSVFAYYFGRKAIGSIKGFVSTLSVAATAFGPLLFAWGLELSGSYRAVLLASAFIPLLLAFLALWVKPPKL